MKKYNADRVHKVKAKNLMALMWWAEYGIERAVGGSYRHAPEIIVKIAKQIGYRRKLPTFGKHIKP